MVEEFVCATCDRSFKRRQAMLVHQYYHEPGYRDRKSKISKDAHACPENKEKFRNVMKEVTADLAYRKKQSDIQRIVQNKDDVRIRKSQAMKIAIEKPGAREKRSESAKKMWLNTEYRKKIRIINTLDKTRINRSNAAKETQNKLEVREKIRATVSTTEFRAHKSIVQREAQNRPETKEKRKKTHASAEYKEKQRIAQSIAQNRPETLDKQSLSRVKAIIEGHIKINSRGKQGKFDSKKAGEVHYRSSWELRAFKMLDEADDVLEFQVEPFSIPYQFDDRSHRCIPDVLVTKKDSKILIEIKPLYRLKEMRTQAKIKAMEEYCKLNDLRFETWTEKELGI